MIPEGVKVEPMRLHRDHRGSVVEPLRPDEIPAQRNAHVVISLPGTIRGNHFHRLGTEVCLVYGPALMRLRKGAEAEDITIPAGEVYRFVIPPEVSHAILNTGSEPGITVAFNTVEHDPAAPDTYRDEIL